MDRKRKIHLIGVGGVGMAGLAALIKANGHDVSGCDLKETPRTRWLASLGVSVAFGHSPCHLDNVEEVIVTPAVHSDNPELAAARKMGLAVRYRGEVLAELVNARDGIAICGSHGKTTTATWIARLLLALGEDAAWCIGGETGDFPVAGAGAGPLVVEADESDGTLSLYRARMLVVNKCEYDHPDHFKTEADYFACYETAKRQAADVIESERLSPMPDLACLGALAEHNRRNARAAVEVARRRGHSLAAIAAVLPQVVAQLPDRRFQCIVPGVYADYAHHPTEMRCAVEMARRVCRGKLRVLFQPHRYSRTKALLADFPASFAMADEVVLCPTYAAFEEPLPGGDVTDLYRACRTARETGGLDRTTFSLSPSCEEAWSHVNAATAEGDVVLLLGAGDIIDLVPSVRRDRTAEGTGTK